VIVRKVAVDDVEALPLQRLAEVAHVARVAERPAGPRKERAGPSEGQEAAGERAFADEPELRLHAGSDESRGLFVNHGGGAGPLLSGDELEKAHEKKLSAARRRLD